jgi:hypothetical protein
LQKENGFSIAALLLLLPRPSTSVA